MSERPKRDTKSTQRYEPNSEGKKGKGKKVPPQKKIKKGRGKGKGKKDPSAPKRAKTAYLCYAEEARSKVKDSNPDLKFGDITKKVSEQWKALTKEERVPYEEKAAQDKQRYEKEKKSYEEKQDKEDEKDDSPEEDEED